MKKKIYLPVISLMLLMVATHAKAQYNIVSHFFYNQCPNINVNITTNAGPNINNLSIEQSWGDGTMDTAPVDTGYTSFVHTFTAAGYYTIKSVLIDNGARIDSVTYVDSMNYCNMFELTAYGDANGNCTYEPATDEILYSYAATVVVDSNGYVMDTITFAGSFYYPETGSSGTVYTYTLLTAPVGYAACGATTETHTLGVANSFVHDYMGFTCQNNTFDLSFYGWFSAGLLGAGSHMFVTNNGCEPINATLTLNHGPKYSYSSNYGGYTATVSGNSVSFNIGTIGAGQTVNLIAIFTANGTLTLGDTTNTTWTVTPLVGDTNPANNTYSEVDTVRASFDPNEKAVSPEGIISAGTLLTYKIGFENTGNDTAHNIHIMDTLSNDLNASTLAIISSTSPVTEEFLKDGSGHTVVKFDFHNINLLDSSHHNNCTGMVVFSVNSKTGLPNGTKIDNTAGIYFDANAVVLTNTAENVIGHTSGITTLSNTNMLIYPNPVADELNINLSGNTYNTVQILNTLGQVMMSRTLQGLNTKVNVKSLPAGMYYISLRGNDGVTTQKFEKL